VTVYLVGAGPGDPGLITRRGAEVLGRAEVVVYDRLVLPGLLRLAPAGALLIDVGKRSGEPSPGGSGRQSGRQEEIHALLIEHGAKKTVVRLKGGDPFVFGRGSEEAEALRTAGIDYEVVPGVSSAFAVPASAGVPVTHRGLSSSVTVVTGHVGDPSAPGGVAWEALARAGGTLVILMGMENRAEIARLLIEGGRAPETPVLVVQWGTSPQERTARVRLDQLATVGLGPPATIVVGAVAGLDLAGRGRGPLAGISVVVTRPRERSDDLASGLAAAGAEVVVLPVIAITGPLDPGPLEEAAGRAGDYDWIVFSSVSAVDRFLALLRDGRALGGARLAAVGPATAAALAGRHLVADLVPLGATAEALVAAMPDAHRGRILFPRAADARDVIGPGLRAKGWEVDEVEAYRTVTARASDGATTALLEAAATADVITFGSPSAVAAYLALAGGRVPATVACIGPVTAAAAEGAGLVVDVAAADHSAAGLVDALIARFRI
jgi:uroporphyrinogen III methyltransferase/synthase